MTSITSHILNTLRIPAWCFSSLELSLRSSLIARIQAANPGISEEHLKTSTVFELSALAYGLTSRPLNTNKNELAKIFGTSDKHWNDIAHQCNQFAVIADRIDDRNVEDAFNHLNSVPTEFISHLIFVDNVSFRSGSHPHALGAIFISKNRTEEDPFEIAVSIVHELAHQELFLINMIDRLVHQSFDYSMLHAPFQGTKRPPIGRIHSAHALFRMINFQPSESPSKVKHLKLLEQTIESFQEGELTPFAKELVNIYREAICNENSKNSFGAMYA